MLHTCQCYCNYNVNSYLLLGDEQAGGIKLVTITMTAAVKCEICQTNKQMVG